MNASFYIRADFDEQNRKKKTELKTVCVRKETKC